MCQKKNLYESQLVYRIIIAPFHCFDLFAPDYAISRLEFYFVIVLKFWVDRNLEFVKLRKIKTYHQILDMGTFFILLLHFGANLRSVPRITMPSFDATRLIRKDIVVRINLIPVFFVHFEFFNFFTWFTEEILNFIPFIFFHLQF